VCLLCVMEPNVTPTREQLINATSNNPDGFGYAFHCGDRIITGRGMDADEVVDRFLRIREGLPNTWAMFHARYTTHGSTSKANCHPFRMNGDPSTVIGHNGIIPIDVPKGDDRSDTRYFADEWLPELLELLDDDKGFAELEQLVGASKVAVFTHDERLSSQVYILNEQMGHWAKGIWWSNDTYKYDWYKTYLSANMGKQAKSWYDDEYPSYVPHNSTEECLTCFAKLGDVDYDSGVCTMCSCCVDCGDYYLECMCYDPKNKSKEVQPYIPAYESCGGFVIPQGLFDKTNPPF
jgi:hypothetical protein